MSSNSDPPDSVAPASEATFSQRTEQLAATDLFGRRKYERHEVELEINFGSEHNFYSGFVENLSAGGVFVATYVAKDVGQILDLSISLPGRSKPVTGRGEVRWFRPFNPESDLPAGIGIRFVELDDGGDELIRKFVKRREPLFYDDE